MRQDDERRGLRCIRLACVAAGPAILSTCVAIARAGDGPGDTPDLTRPNEMPAIVSTPATPAPTVPKTAVPPRGRAVLALPGITAPGVQKPVIVPPPVTSSPSTDPVPGGLLLDAPSEMRGGPAPLGPLNNDARSTTPGRTQRPLVLDSPDEEPVPIDGPPVRTSPPSRRPSATPRVDPQPIPPTQKRGRLFGLLPGMAPAPSNSATPATGSGASISTKVGTPGRSVVEGSPAELAAEAALKKRIEKQAREAVGDRARMIDVRVEGKAAVVQARGVKLFQKRGVRKSLESIPALSGLRSSIEILD